MTAKAASVAILRRAVNYLLRGRRLLLVPQLQQPHNRPSRVTLPAVM